jgi:hypothetical protein
LQLPLLILLAISCGDGTTAPESKSVGPNGGYLSFGNGAVTLVFPRGALSQEISVTAEPTNDYPSNWHLLPGTVIELGPPNIAFLKPIEMTVRFDREELQDGVLETELRLYQLDGDRWRVTAGNSVDMQVNRVTAEITRTGTTAIAACWDDFGTEAPPNVVGPSGGQLSFAGPEWPR